MTGIRRLDFAMERPLVHVFQAGLNHPRSAYQIRFLESSNPPDQIGARAMADGRFVHLRQIDSAYDEHKFSRSACKPHPPDLPRWPSLGANRGRIFRDMVQANSPRSICIARPVSASVLAFASRSN